jgi:hypothetical protein
MRLHADEVTVRSEHLARAPGVLRRENPGHRTGYCMRLTRPLSFSLPLAGSERLGLVGRSIASCRCDWNDAARQASMPYCLILL